MYILWIATFERGRGAGYDTGVERGAGKGEDDIRQCR